MGPTWGWAGGMEMSDWCSTDHPNPFINGPQILPLCVRPQELCVVTGWLVDVESPSPFVELGAPSSSSATELIWCFISFDESQFLIDMGLPDHHNPFINSPQTSPLKTACMRACVNFNACVNFITDEQHGKRKKKKTTLFVKDFTLLNRVYLALCYVGYNKSQHGIY